MQLRNSKRAPLAGRRVPRRVRSRGWLRAAALGIGGCLSLLGGTAWAQQRIQIDLAALDVSAAGEIVVPLPDGSSVAVIPTRFSDVGGIQSIEAVGDGARLVLTRDRNSSYGYLDTASALYVIDTVRDGIAALTSSDDLDDLGERLRQTLVSDAFVDPAEISSFVQRLRAPPEPGANARLAELQSIVDVAFFYDPVMVTDLDRQAPHTRVQAAIDYMNAAYRLHGVSLEARAVFVGPTPTEFGFDPLNQLAGSLEVAQIADRFGADLVHAIFEHRGQSYCGVAYLLSRFGASSYNCDLNHVIAHEIGHNFGMNHDRANSSPTGVPELDGFNYGYVCAGAGTIMSYPGSPRLPHYSSPVLSYKGVPCGRAEPAPDAAHNAKVLDITRATVTSRRTPRPIIGAVSFMSQAAITLNEENPLPVVLEVVRTGQLDQEASVEIAAIDGATSEGLDYSSFSTRLEFAPFEERKSVTLMAINDEEHEPTEDFEIVLRYPIGVSVPSETVNVEVFSSDPNRGKAQFATTGTSVWESVGTVPIEVKRIESLDNTLTIGFETFDVSARAGQDYNGALGQITFGPGESSKTISVSVTNDALFQGYLTYRQFGVRLTGSGIAQPSEHIVSIFNDDNRSGKPQLAAEPIVTDEAVGQLVVRLTRLTGAEGSLEVTYETTDGSARAGQDYEAATGTIIFSHGQVTKAIPLSILDNNLFDGTREFALRVRDRAGNVSETTIRIQNDDPNRGFARFAVSSVATNENVGTLVIEVTRSGGLEHALSVLYRTSAGTAAAGTDFQIATGVVSFALGETSKTISVRVIDDAVREALETFTVVLAGDVAEPASVAVQILDDDPVAVAAAQSPVATETGAAAQDGGGGSVDMLSCALLLLMLLLSCTDEARVLRGAPRKPAGPAARRARSVVLSETAYAVVRGSLGSAPSRADRQLHDHHRR